MDIIINYFAQRGIYGIIILMLIFVIIYLVRRNDNLFQQVQDLQSKRVMDASQYNSTYIDVAKETVGISKDNLNSLSLLQRSVDALAGSMQKLIDNKIS